MYGLPASLRDFLTQHVPKVGTDWSVCVKRASNNSLAPLYRDLYLNNSVSNPLRLSTHEAITDVFLQPGLYRVIITDPTGAEEYDFRDISLRGSSLPHVSYVVATVSDLVNDEQFHYAAQGGFSPNRVAENDIVQVTTENLQYRVLDEADSAPHITTAAGVKLALVDEELRPEGFETIEDAIRTAAISGRSLRGTPGKTYVFNEGLSLEGYSLDLNFEGCRLVRGMNVADSQPTLRIEQEFSAPTYDTADEILTITSAEYDYGNGPTFVPRITVSDASDYAVGDIIRVMGDEIIPSISPWTHMRYADMGEVGAVDYATNEIYLIRPFSEKWEAKRIVRLSTNFVQIRGGEWSDEEGYPLNRFSPMIVVIGAVRPVFRNMWFRDTASTQLFIKSCYEGRSLNNRFDRPRHDATLNAYGYGEKVVCGTVRHVQNGALGTGCRHVFDTGGLNLEDHQLGSASPADFGGAVECVCRNGDAMDSLNAPWADHPDAYRTQFIGCTSRWTNRRAPGCTLWGLELRGRASSAEGGQYEGLQPIRIEPSTSIPMTLRNIQVVKHAPVQQDAARGPMIEIAGENVVGGARARVNMHGLHLSQRLGRKEMLDIRNSDVVFEGVIEYEADLSNASFSHLADSSITILGLDADFSGMTNVTPMLSILSDDTSAVCAPGLVRIMGAPVAGSTIVLTDFEQNVGKAAWYNVIVDGPTFAGDGWRNENNAGQMQAIVRYATGDTPPNDVTVNFSGTTGAKTVTWSKGCAMECIYVSVNPTIAGTYVESATKGSFVGQRVLLSNVGGTIDFTIQASADIAVTAPRTVAPGQTAMMRWTGTQWQV